MSLESTNRAPDDISISIAEIVNQSSLTKNPYPIGWLKSDHKPTSSITISASNTNPELKPPQHAPYLHPCRQKIISHGQLTDPRLQALDFRFTIRGQSLPRCEHFTALFDQLLFPLNNQVAINAILPG